MDHRTRSVVTRVGIGLAGLTTVVAFVAPHGTSKADRAPDRTPSRQAHRVAPESQEGTPADTGCLAVDANGAPLVDSQYEQRTGHPPC
jgi:hypothetical protein